MIKPIPIMEIWRKSRGEALREIFPFALFMVLLVLGAGGALIIAASR
jgi:hypothetical protein